MSFIYFWKIYYKHSCPFSDYITFCRVDIFIPCASRISVILWHAPVLKRLNIFKLQSMVHNQFSMFIHCSIFFFRIWFLNDIITGEFLQGIIFSLKLLLDTWRTRLPQFIKIRLGLLKYTTMCIGWLECIAHFLYQWITIIN